MTRVESDTSMELHLTASPYVAQRAVQSLLQEAGHKCATKCWDVMMAVRTTSEADNELAPGESDVELLLTDCVGGVARSGQQRAGS